MANETTSSTYSTRTLSYVLAEEVLPPNLADIVAVALCNDHDIDGMPSNVVQFAVANDLNAASSGTEGTAISTNTALSMASAIQATVVEGALVRSTVTDRAMAVKYPGFPGIEALIDSGDLASQRRVFQEEVNRLAQMCIEKMESDVVALVTGLSTSVGTSGVDFSVADAFTAIYTYDTLEPVTREAAWLLAPNQVDELRRDIAVAGGGLGGAVWFQQADASFLAARNLPKNGFIGSFLGRPIYQYAHSLRVLSDASANVNGALIAIGRGSPDGGQLGAFCVARRGGLKVRIDKSAADRGAIIVVSMEYVAFEVRDTHGVRIRTDA
jgi:hypothetical protein